MATPDPLNAEVDPESQRIITISQSYLREAEQARLSRMNRNRKNREAYFGHQDWTGKIEGQSTEFLPKTAMAVEQFGAFIKRSLTQFGDWFSVEAPPRSPLSDTEIRKMLRCFMERVHDGNSKKHFGVIMSDALKMASLESLLILKVHGKHRKMNRHMVEPGTGEIVDMDVSPWTLQVDIVRTEDYFPDPRGDGLYEIHRVERDLHEVMAMAEGDDPLYDIDQVEQLNQQLRTHDIGVRQEHERGQDEATVPKTRKRVVIDEYWGTLLDDDGTVIMRNAVWAIANDRFLIRPPERNPFWHGESPFVAVPLVRVPHSVWHKALYDEAVDLNLAMNELYNLMLDGGLSSVWGVREVRTDWLVDPSQVAGGLPQGATLEINEQAPANASAVQQSSTGQVPQDALGMFNISDREFMAASLTNDIKLGMLPSKQVRATEVMEASQAQSTTLDSIAGDIEHDGMQPVIRKSWMLLLQFLEDLPSEDVIGAIGPRKALELARMSPGERLDMFQGCQFKVHGLSSTMNRARDFQKLMGLMQGVSGNPMLMEAFMRRTSPDKILEQMFKQLNMNPEDFEPTPEEQEQSGERMQRTQALAQMMGNGGSPPGQTGEAGMQSEINQEAAPSDGL